MIPKATYDKIILKQVVATKSESNGLIATLHSGNDTAFIGEVVDVGPGLPITNIHYVPMDLKIGDKVVYPKIGPSRITVKKQDYISMRIIEVLAKIEE